MNNKTTFPTILLVFMVLLFSCGGAGEKTVMIGEQTWMVKNLDVSTFRNGDTIPEAKTAEEWIKAGQEGRPAWSYFYNDTENSKKYGKLYNWYAVSDPRTLAPQGWHIPGNDEWLMLSKALIENVGAKMKSRSGWENKGNGTNESGFTGLPGGWRDSAGEFRDIGYIGAWWSSSEIDALNATYWDVTENESQFYNSNTIKTEGHYIRCVSGETVSSVAETDQAEIVESEGETLNIKSAKIGSQVWMSENLDVSRFRNGDEIPELENGDEWESAGRESRPAWCYYNNDPEYGKKFGKLYNWHAVNDPRGLAPEGWHIPTNDEWAELNDYLGDYAGFKMKSVSDWKVSVNESEHVGNGDNSSGFNGLPGGKRGFASHHGFTYSGEFGYWWSASEIDGSAWYWILAIEDRDGEAGYARGNELLSGQISDYDIGQGFSVRCISDSPGKAENFYDVLYQLQGKWQHTEDTSNYLVFEKYLQKEIAGGLTEWTVEEFVLSDKCMNETDKDRFPGGDKEIFISVIESDMCWMIVELTDSELSLGYVGRGNTLTYRRVE